MRERCSSVRMLRIASCIALVLMCGGAFTAKAAVKKVKAEVTEPVLEELMGGCSLACAFPWSVETARAGAKRKAVPQLSDESARNAWVEAAEGARLNFVLPARLAPHLERTPVYGFNMINGYWADEEKWERHARLKRARILYNGKALAEIAFADTRRWQEVFFGDLFIRSGDRLELEVLEVYRGSGAREGGLVAISEISLQGAH